MNFARFSLAFGVIAQASVSIANFAIGFILVRVLDSAGFGEYGIGFALALLCASATNALLDTPATVIAGEYCNQERTAFQFSLISACLALCLFFMAIALIVIVLGAGAVYIGISAGVISAGLMCGAGLLMREVFVQMAFIESEDHIAAKINLIYMVTVLVAVAILGYTANISAHIALIANTVISLGCALVGGFMLRRYWFTPTFDIVGHWRKLYNHGKWSLGGVVVGWFHQQGFVYLVAGVAGVSAVGQLNAARLIVSPLLFLQTGMQNVVMPRVARLWDSDKLAGYKMARQLCNGLVLLTLAYSVYCFVFAEAWVQLLIGTVNDQLLSMMFLWLAWVLVVNFRSNNALLLQCARQFSFLAGKITIGMLISFVICFFWVSNAGVSGAVPSLVIGEVALVLLTQLRVRQLWKDYQ